MSTNNTVNLDNLLKIVLGYFPTLNLLEQRLSLELYRQLSEGQPVACTTIAQRLGVPVEIVNHILNGWPGVFSDSMERVVGYWGLAIPQAYKSPHSLKMNGRTLSAWCAWDTLFLPQLLEQAAQVESISPSGERISLTLTSGRVDQIKPPGVHMSFLLPDQAAVQKDIVTTFCHFIHFFPSREAGENWARQHPGTFVLSMDDAVSLARRKNEEQYREVLQSRVA